MLCKNEKAVSPVIAVILMVAITVILAAVIGAFVFDMGNRLSSNYVVGATASERYDGTNYDIVVTFTGGPDATHVTMLNSSIDGATTGTKFDSKDNPSVGYTKTYNNEGSVGMTDHIIVTATFSDGASLVILDTHV